MSIYRGLFSSGHDDPSRGIDRRSESNVLAQGCSYTDEYSSLRCFSKSKPRHSDKSNDVRPRSSCSMKPESIRL